MAAADLERIYRSLRLIRRAEEEVARIYPSDKIKSPVHLSIGQEAVSVGVCDVLRPTTWWRRPIAAMPPILPRAGRCAACLPNSMARRPASPAARAARCISSICRTTFLARRAVVGTTIPVAVGYALALKRTQDRPRGRSAFFGDGATEEGVFAESLNFAALQKLPMLFVCENNFYAIHTPLTRRWATQRLCERVETYGMPAHRSRTATCSSCARRPLQPSPRMRRGEGPAFLECRTYRWREHVGPNEDFDAGLPRAAELRSLAGKRSDERVGAHDRGLIADGIDAEVEAEIADAVAFAEPAHSPTISTAVYQCLSPAE